MTESTKALSAERREEKATRRNVLKFMEDKK